ncbi:hypothetical protein ACHAPT_011992 [Fusarium lateritium]
MGVYTKLADGIDEVDIIIAGGGAAACVVAGRLAEADPSLSILVIEGGPDNRGVQNIEHPVFFLDHLLPTSKTTIFYKGNKAEQLNGREPVIACGGTLGGGSSINFSMYTRAQRSDLDSWNTPGWSANDLIPFLQKLETFHGEKKHASHGTGGPVQISSGTFRSKNSESDFIHAAAQVGWPEHDDLQVLDTNNGFQRWHRHVSPDGRRQDTATAYLHEKMNDEAKYPNLHILVQSKVVRVILDDEKRAVGVEYTPNPAFQVDTNVTQHPKLAIKARKLVVVSCGALGTPLVLERSGLGDPKVLEKAGIPVQVDLPGVGSNYEDHQLILYPYKTNLQPHETIDQVLRNPHKRQELIDAKDPVLGWNSIDVSSKLRPSDADVAALGPEFQKSWDKDFKNKPDRPIMLMGLVSCFLGDPSSVPEGQYVTIGNYTAYPYSRGHIHVTGPEITDVPDFDKKSREIIRRTSMYRGELEAGHPQWPAGSKAASPEFDGKDVVYSAEDDEAIEQWIRGHVETTWHSIATCKMAPKEENGVVDGRLNVWGTKGLKLADLSIVPKNVGGNTGNTAMLVGEKAAHLIIKDLGL